MRTICKGIHCDPMLVGILSGEYPDKHWIAVNTFTNSPHFGRILVAWTGVAWSGNNGTLLGLRSSYSDDQGQTWSKPLKVTTETGSQQNSQPVFLSDGS